MAHVEIIKRNKKEYFYLTKNIRLSLNKWKKVRIYLGDKKPTKEELAQSTKKIEAESQKFIENPDMLIFLSMMLKRCKISRKAIKNGLNKSRKVLERNSTKILLFALLIIPTP